MAGIVETITRSISIAKREDRLEVKISLQEDQGLSLFTMDESPSDRIVHSRYNQIVIAAEDVPGFSRWLASRVQPQPSIWDRLADYSAPPSETPSS